MQRLLRVFGLLLVLAFTVSPLASVGCHATRITYNLSSDDVSPEQLMAEAAMPTLMVLTGQGGGSGVVIDSQKGLILTAAHVVWQEAGFDENGLPTPGSLRPCSVMKTFPIMFLADVEVMYLDVDKDLALLHLKDQRYLYEAKLAKAGPTMYQRCWAAGHPHLLLNTTVTDGRIEALDEEGFIRHSAPTTFGNSGGPLFILEGRSLVVVSIVQRVVVEGFQVAVTHLGFSATLDNIQSFLKVAESVKIPMTPMTPKTDDGGHK